MGAGWDYQTQQAPKDPLTFSEILQKMGEASWELVAVSEDVLYFKRPKNYEAQLRQGVAAENAAPGDFTAGLSAKGYVADAAAGQKKLSSITSQNAGPDGVAHTHRVLVIVGKDMQVVSGVTDVVDGHTHPISLVGSVDEVDGHTHTFEVF